MRRPVSKAASLTLNDLIALSSVRRVTLVDVRRSQRLLARPYTYQADMYCPHRTVPSRDLAAVVESIRSISQWTHGAHLLAA